MATASRFFIVFKSLALATAGGVKAFHAQCSARRLAATMFAIASVGGCFPYRETVRPDIRGQVTNTAGAPVPKAVVVACSRRWFSSAETCDAPTRTVADDDGRFVLDEVGALDWCCLGEAPRWQSRVVACDGTHRSQIADVVSPTTDLGLTIDGVTACTEPEATGP
jgi:hypothetical protein